MTHKARTSSRQFPLSWALLATVSHVSPSAFSSLCLGLSLLLCPMSAQQPSVLSVLGSRCCCVPCQPSSLQFPLSWALLAAVSHVSPAAFSFLCLGLSLPLCPTSAQQPSVLSVLGSPCRCVPCQPSGLQLFPLSWALLAAVSHVSPAAFSSLCLGLSLPLCPMSAQQPSVLSALGSPCRCVPRQPSSLQFPLSWALLAAVSHVSPAASVLSVLGSPCRCVPCQPSGLQLFPLSWALLAAVSHVSPAAFSSLCLGLSLPLCHMSAQQPSVPSVLGSPCRCVPCQPSSLQFSLSWALLAAVSHVSPAAFSSLCLVAVSHVSPAAFSSLCLGLSLPLCPMSAQRPSVVPSVLGSPCRCVPRQPSSLQFPLSWALLTAVSHVSPAAFSSLCLGLSLPLCPMSAQQPSVLSVLGSPCRCVPCQPSSLQFPLSCRCVPCQPSSLQFPLSWALLVAVSHVSPAAFSSLCLGLPSVLPSLVSVLFFIFPFSSSLLGCKSRLFSQACDWSLWRHGQVSSTFSFSG